MLTGNHNLGDRGASVDFSEQFNNAAIWGAEQSYAVLDSSELRQLRDILNAHFGEWTPCGPDGPFPADGEWVLVSVEYIGGDQTVATDYRVEDRWKTWDSGPYRVRAFCRYPEPYNPEEQRP